VSEEILDRVQADTKEAMRAGDKETTAALRMVSSALQGAAKEGESDGIAVLQRERKKRLEAAEAYEKGGRSEQAEAERAEAELIARYLPEQISDEELAALVDEAIAQTGADSVKQMGQVIGVVMGRVEGRADGKRVSGAVRERLGS
jgi:uncharacterized protein YqeY